MKCLLDLDGVLVDYVGGCRRLHDRPDPYASGFDRWDFVAEFGMSAASFYAPQGRDFWADLDWTPDGRQIFNLIHKHFGPDNTCLLTSPILTEGCYDGKVAWIRKHLPREYHRRFLIGPAKEFCAGPGRVLFDDNDENVAKFTNAGGFGVLVKRPWNQLRNINVTAVESVANGIEWINLASAEKVIRSGVSVDVDEIFDAAKPSPLG